MSGDEITPDDDGRPEPMTGAEAARIADEIMAGEEGDADAATLADQILGGM